MSVEGFKCIVSNFSGNDTWADLDEPVVLDEDGVTGQVAMDDGRVTGVEITAEEEQENPHKVYYWRQLEIGEKRKPTWELTGSVCTISSKPVGPNTSSEGLLAELYY